MEGSKVALERDVKYCPRVGVHTRPCSSSEDKDRTTPPIDRPKEQTERSCREMRRGGMRCLALRRAKASLVSSRRRGGETGRHSPRQKTSAYRCFIIDFLYLLYCWLPLLHKQMQMENPLDYIHAAASALASTLPPAGISPEQQQRKGKWEDR
ncbi:hypothetical protein VTN02DRAFT_2016 [Thermoascus thermophilus]